MTLLFGHFVTANCPLTQVFWHCVDGSNFNCCNWGWIVIRLKRKRGNNTIFWLWRVVALLKCYETISWCLSKGAGFCPALNLSSSALVTFSPLWLSFQDCCRTAFTVPVFWSRQQCLIQTAPRHYQQSGNQAPVANALKLLSPLFKSTFQRRDRLEETEVEWRFWCEHTKLRC